MCRRRLHVPAALRVEALRAFALPVRRVRVVLQPGAGRATVQGERWIIARSIAHTSGIGSRIACQASIQIQGAGAPEAGGGGRQWFRRCRACRHFVHTRRWEPLPAISNASIGFLTLHPVQMRITYVPLSDRATTPRFAAFPGIPEAVRARLSAPSTPIDVPGKLRNVPTLPALRTPLPAIGSGRHQSFPGNTGSTPEDGLITTPAASRSA